MYGGCVDDINLCEVAPIMQSGFQKVFSETGKDAEMSR